MSKKERMLNYIQRNVQWFLSTDASTEVIPYYSLTSSVFSRVQEYISDYVDIDDVVCLVSTSIMAPGKSGILFTTDAMYCKSWGLLTTKYVNYYWAASVATFDFHNDFYEDRMKEIMNGLYEIGVEEDEKIRIEEEKNKQLSQTINNIVDIGKIVGTAALGGMALVDIISSIGDSVVAQNNDKIAQEIARLENSSNEKTVSAITIYKNFIPLFNQYVNICEAGLEADDGIDEEIGYAMIASLRDILLELYYQTLDNEDISPEDEEEYKRFGDWLSFWALMFYDGDQFRETYPIELLEEMPECWSAIIELLDQMLEDVLEDSFSDTISLFANTVVSNSEALLELMSDSDWDDAFFESMIEIIEGNNQAVKNLEEVLDNATDYLNDVLPDRE